MLKSLWQQVVKVTAPSQSYSWKWTRTVCFSCRIRNYVASLSSFEQVDTNRAHDVWILIFFRSNLRLLGIISFSGRSLQKWLYQWNWLQDAEGAGREGGISSQDWEGGEGGLGLIGTFTAVCDTVCLFGCWQVQFFCRGVENPMIGINLAVMQQSTLVCLQAATSAELMCVACPLYTFVHVAQSQTSLQQHLLWSQLLQQPDWASTSLLAAHQHGDPLLICSSFISDMCVSWFSTSIALWQVEQLHVPVAVAQILHLTLS